MLIQVWNFIKINFFAAVFKLFYQHSSGKFCVTIERFASFVYFLSIFSRSRSSYLQAFCEKCVFKIFSEFKGKHLCQSLLSNKVAGCFKKRLLHRSFPVIFLKFIRTAMFCKTSSYKVGAAKFQATSDCHFSTTRFIFIVIVSYKKQ